MPGHTHIPVAAAEADDREFVYIENRAAAGGGGGRRRSAAGGGRKSMEIGRRPAAKTIKY